MRHLNNKIPSKTFLFGEYAVLYGAPALVIAHEPYFEFGALSNSKSVVHEKSPAGKFLLENQKSLEINFFDPHKKKGGFGRSTAEFIVALSHLDLELTTDQVYKKYLSFFSDHQTKPSAADLVCQFEGSSILFKNQPLELQKMDWPFKDLSLIIAHTNNKVETHDHLNRDLSGLNFTSLAKISEKAFKAFQEASQNDFLECLFEFSHEQETLKLLHPHTKGLIKDLQADRGVQLARGCGAFGADVLAIMVKKESKTEDYFETFESLNIDFVARI